MVRPMSFSDGHDERTACHSGIPNPVRHVPSFFSLVLDAPAIPFMKPVRPVAPEEPDVRGHAETILLIEGNRTIWEPLVMVLSKYGYHVLVADSDEQALSVWDRHQNAIKAVVSDCDLGQSGTGLALLRKFSRAKPSLVMVLASGSMSPDLIHELERSTAIQCLPKPFSFLELLEMLRAGLDAQRQRQP